MNSFETKFATHLRKLYRRKGDQLKLRKNETTGTCSFEFGYIPVNVVFNPEVGSITLSTKVFQFNDDKFASANVDNIMDKACEFLKDQPTATMVKRDFVLNYIVVESTAPLGMIEEGHYEQFCEYISAHAGSYRSLRNVVIDLVAAEYKAVREAEKQRETNGKEKDAKGNRGWFRRSSFMNKSLKRFKSTSTELTAVEN